MAELSLAFLGPLSVVYDRQPLTQFRTKAVPALLAYLAWQRHQVARREVLMDLLWPDVLPKSAQANLRHTLYHLKQAIAVVANAGGEAVPLVIADRSTVQLNPDGCIQTDLEKFEAGTGAAAAMSDLEAAVALYRDDFLSGFYLPNSPGFENWLQERRTAYQRRCLDALRRLTKGYIGSGDLDQAEAMARRQLALDNLREAAHGQLLQVLAMTGRRSAALAHYRVFERLLQDELGVTPSSPIQALIEAIRADDFGGGAVVLEVPAGDAAPAHLRHNLAAPLTPFVGRQAELAALDDVLTQSQTRLVTILGPGGIGKTRLALAAARRALAAGAFADGVFFVPLAGLADSDRIISAIADAFQLRLESGETQLRAYLEPKQLLLVLDNFEHLLAGAELINRLLAAAPRLLILTTSRERLQLHGEQLFPLQGLTINTQAETDDARELFLQAARRLRPDFAPGPEDLATLYRICRVVDGMPLALELAAAWLDMLTLAEIAAEIQTNLDFLETDLRDLPRRHRSMRAVFETSWRQLSAGEQRLLARVSIFRGGFTRAAATAITGASIRELSRLVNKSLLRFDLESGRYHSHELLRQFSAAQLGVDNELRERFNRHFCDWLVGQKDELHGPGQAAKIKLIEADIDNIRGAIASRVARDEFAGLQPVLATLHDFYVVRGQLHEAITLFGELAGRLDAQPDLDPHTHVWLLIWLSRLNGIIFRRAESDTAWKEARAVLAQPIFQSRDTRAEVAALNVQEAYSIFREDAARAVRLFRASAAVYEAAGDDVALAECLVGLGRGLRTLDDFPAARAAFTRSLAVGQKLGDPVLQFEPQLLIGLLMVAEDPLRAEEMLQRVIAQIRQVNHPERYRMGLRYLAVAQMMSGKFAAALATTRQRRQNEIETGSHIFDFPMQGFTQAMLNLHLGRYQEAAQIEQILARAAADDDYVSDAFTIAGLLALATGDLTQAQRQFQAAQTHFASRWLGSWIHGFELGLALAAVLTEEFAAAREFIQSEVQTLVRRYETGLNGAAPVALGVAAAGCWYAAQGQAEKGIELYALARQNGLVANSRWVADVIGTRLSAAAAAIPAQKAAAAQARGAGLDLLAAAKGLLAEWAD